MKGGRAGRPVPRALFPVDRPPGKGRALQAELVGPFGGGPQAVAAPGQSIGSRPGLGIGQHRQHIHLGVPEGMAVVARTGQTLGRDSPRLGPGAGLQHLPQRIPHRLLNLVVAIDLHVGAIPEIVEVVALGGQQPVEAGVARHHHGPGDLVLQGGQRPHPGPAVGHDISRYAASSRPGS